MLATIRIDQENSRTAPSIENVHFNRPKEDQPNLLQIDDQRGLLSRIGYAALTLFHLIAETFHRSIQRFLSWAWGEHFPTAQFDEETKQHHYPETELPWSPTDTESAGLFLYDHGLRGSPLDWQQYKEELTTLTTKFPGSHHITPRIAEAGNCALKIAAEPCLEIVERYRKQFPDSPIFTLGTSNGSRINQYIETHLDPDLPGDWSYTSVSIAGVYYGTELIDIADKTCMLWAANLDQSLAEEFHWGSEVAEAELTAWRDRQIVWQEKNIKVRHLFCASLEDDRVFSISSSLPLPPEGINAQYDYKIYQGESHISIVPRILDDVVEWLCEGQRA